MADSLGGWKLRLFCSVDVIGSTAYKSQRSLSSSGHLEPTWSQLFREFYGEFPVALLASYADLGDDIDKPRHEFEIWKFVGDEILFCVEIQDYRDVVGHVVALKRAVKKYSDQTWLKEPLSLKAAAWLAGFPVLNTEVEIKSGNARVRDFIGPSVDAGFRIARFATHQRLALSADLAFLLADALLSNNRFSSKCDLHYQGKEELKGVLQGKPYPIVWVDMNDGQLTREERLLRVNRQTDHVELRAFLQEFIEETGGLHIPFIKDDGGKRYDRIPKEFERAYAALEEQKDSDVVERGYDETPNDCEVKAPDETAKELKEPQSRPEQ